MNAPDTKNVAAPSASAGDSKSFSMTPAAAPSASAGDKNSSSMTSPTASPGALLKLARERAGLAVDDLAAQIKLAKSTLEALERDDFAALSEPVYVRGYYRKIAKVLPVSEKELIEAYAQCNPTVAMPVMQRIPQLAGGVDAGVSRRARGQGLAVTAVIVGLTLGALLLFADQNKPARLAIAEPETQSSAATPTAAASPTTTETLPSAMPVESDPASAAPSASAGDRKSFSMTPAAAPDAAAPAAPAPVAAAISPAAASAAPNQLVLEFTESCFVRVEDSRNKTLAIGLVRGGERQVLDGQPPYTVFLGNARNVKAYHQGKQVDFSARINAQNDTARFTVP